MKKRVTVVALILLLILSSCSIFALSENFDLRNYIAIPVKNQFTTGACWILTMGTVFETNLNFKNNIVMKTSARHADYATSQSFYNNVVNGYGFSRKVNSGGTAEMALAYLTSGIGPVPEEEMPFSGDFSDIYYGDIINKTRKYKVDEWVAFPNVFKLDDGTCVDNINKEKLKITYTNDEVLDIRNRIKQHIMDNGAVYAAINAESGFSTYYNYSTFAYNCDDYTRPQDHAVTIIGWDDNYSSTNFKEGHQPSSDGAYIVQNSWGYDTRLNNGTFYISYEDALIESGVYGIVSITNINYDNIYQYDKLGRNQYFKISNISSAYGANVYKRYSRNKEILSQAGISSFFDVDCEVYVNPYNGEINSSKLIKVGEGLVKAGYNTIYFDRPVVVSGKEFAIVVKYKKVGDMLAITTISRFDSDNPGNCYKNVTSEEGRSFIGVNVDNLIDLYSTSTPNANVCIKAFANTVLYGDVNNDGQVNTTDLAMLKGYLVSLISLDEDLADVNGDGVVSTLDVSLLMSILVKLR